MTRTVRIECFGHDAHRSLVVERPGCRWLFDFGRPGLSSSQPSVGLFVDYWATMNRAWLRFPQARRFALLMEPGASEAFVRDERLRHRFAVVLTHDARLLERGDPFVEFPFGTTWVESVLEDGAPAPCAKSALVSMVGARHVGAADEGHGLRNDVLDMLDRRGGVDCFGKGVRWIDSKLDGLASYRFSIAMENCRRDFYFTEKLIDCLLTDTVPIYFGCEGIGRYFDPRGMLGFATVAELEMHLDALDEDRYQAMLPFVRANLQRALDAGFVTRAQLYARVVDLLSSRFESPPGATLRPLLVRAAEGARRLLSGDGSRH